MVSLRRPAAVPAAALVFGGLAPLCLIFAALFRPVGAIDMEYCSDINTSSNPGNSSIYQSTGLCSNFCIGGYAFAILQNDQCWCSNYAPGKSESSTDSCDKSCPGYPTDICGGPGLYGYLELFKMPSGTQKTSGSGATSKKEVSVSTPGPSTVDTTTRTSSSSKKTTSRNSKTSSPITSAPSSSESSSSATWTPTPVTSFETVTGQVRIVTITPTAPPSLPNNDEEPAESKSSGLNTGQAVGITVGLVALAAIIGLLIFFFVRRKRQQNAAAAAARTGSPASGSVLPQRTMSENSRYMLGTDGHRVVVEGWDGDDTPGSRRSRLMPVDPRLDPFAPVYQRGDGSKSRESVQTIQDNHDYSRRVHQTGPVLRATNPDA